MELHEVTNELDLRVAIPILVLCVTLIIIAVKKGWAGAAGNAIRR